MGLRGLKPLHVLAAAAGTALLVAFTGDGGDAPLRPGFDPPRPPDDDDELDAFGIAYARGIASPAWPLDDAARKLTGDFGDSRDGGSRIHVAEDLVAKRGTKILATEPGVVVEARDTWYEGSGVLLLQTDSGIVIAFGEIEPGSFDELGVGEGTRVERGQGIARVGRHYQLHFETYTKGTRATSRWMKGEAPPKNLLDPLAYLRAAARS